MNHEIDFKALINVKMIVAKGDINTLIYLINRADLSELQLQQCMRLAVKHNRILMLQFLESHGVSLDVDYINIAFGLGYIDMTMYLYKQGLRVDLSKVMLAQKAYADISEVDLLHYLESINVDAERMNVRLIDIDNFVLCLNFLSTMRQYLNIIDVLSSAIKHGYLEIAHKIIDCYAMIDDWIKRAIQSHKDSVVAFICDNFSHKIINITEIFHKAYDYFNGNIIKKLVLTLDPNLELDIHKIKWRYMASTLSFDMIQLFCTHLPNPEFGIHELVYAPVPVLTYLDSIGWISNLVMKGMLQYAILNQLPHLLKFCAASPKAEFYAKSVKIYASEYKTYDFLCVLMDLGVDVHQAMQKHHLRRFMKDYTAKLTLKTGRGLSWSAAACYVKHYKTMPDPKTVPADVNEILHLAQYSF